MKVVNPHATVDEFSIGGVVIYVPNHIDGNLNSPEAEYGIVKSITKTAVFANFLVNDHIQETAQSCNPEDLLSVHEIPFRKFRLGMAAMLEIMLSKGMHTSLTPFVYSAKHLNKIADKIEYFFKYNPEINEKEFLSDICGDEDEMNEKYGKLEGYSDLSKAFENYFNEE